MTEPRIAWFTPLQPVESGISLYSEDLLPILSQVMHIDVIVDGYRPSHLGENDNLRVRQYRSYRPAEYDLAVYQVGNSPAHLYMLAEIEQHPGLLVLHDTVLNHLFVQQAARDGTLQRYREEMGRRYGDDGLRAADRVLKGQAPADLFRFPMSEDLVAGSRGTVVHSEYARQSVLEWHPGSTIFRVPHGLRMPEYVDKVSAREELGLPQDQFIMASVTHINPYKRLDVVLRAFRQFRRSVPSRLILAGSVSPNYPLHRMISHLGLDQVVDLPGYVEDRIARLLAAAADVLVNLRYPTAGETSGSLLHGMAAGRPVLVSQTGSFVEAPVGTVIPIPVDALEERTLLAMLQRLAGDKGLRDEIGSRARAFIEREHSLQRWADGYCDAIGTVLGRTLQRPRVSLPEEPVRARAVPARQGDALSDVVAREIAELGLGGDERLLLSVAKSMTDLGLGIGKISGDHAANGNGQETSDDRI